MSERRRSTLVSESNALSVVLQHLANARVVLERQRPESFSADWKALNEIREAVEVLLDMERQLSRGVHVNPTLAIVGNPGGRQVCLSKGGVQAVVYQHEKDGTNRAHGFGDAPIRLKDGRGSLTIAGLEERTGVSMYGSADKKTITLRGDHGQRLWDYFEEDDGR